MRKFLIIQQLESILTDAPSAARIITQDDPPTHILFFRIHLPFLLLFPVFYFLSPFGPLFFGKTSSWKMLIPALSLALGALAMAITFDRILLHRNAPPTDISGIRYPANVALYLHLPVSASGFFFLFHPVVGFVMLILSIGLSIQRSIRNAATVHGIGRRRSAIYYLTAVILWVGFFALLLFLWNLRRTYGIFEGIGIL